MISGWIGCRHEGDVKLRETQSESGSAYLSLTAEIVTLAAFLLVSAYNEPTAARNF